MEATAPPAALLRALVEASNDLAVVHGGAGPDLVLASPAARARFPDVADLDTLLARVHPEDRGEVARAVQGGAHCLARVRVPPERWVMFDLHTRDLRGDAAVAARLTTLHEVGAREVERRALQERLAHLATHDELTGLWNRAGFAAALEAALAARSAGAVGVFFLDLDDFKAMNDGFGHDLGDRLLQTVAARLEAVVGRDDVVSRFGGDEFLVLTAPRASHDDVLALADACRAAVAAPVVVAGRRVVTSASVGVTFLRDQDGADAVVQEADVAMYAAKSAGRDRTAVFDRRVQAASRRRVAVAQALRRALAGGELTLVYQAKHALHTGALVGFEALLRWRAPDGLGVDPGEFVPMAEKLGLIAEIGAWTTREAVRQLAEWRRRWPGHAGLTMAVNLSWDQIRTSAAGARFVEVVRTALDDHGVPGACLEIELTESALLHDAGAVRETLQALRALGVRLAVDDFGTGYSSLAALRTFPLDVLKLDRAFVSGLGTDPAVAQIVAFVVALARGLGAVCVAEGVEREEQAALLREMGVDLAQGFLFAPALSPTACEELLSPRVRLPPHPPHRSAHPPVP